MFAKARFWGKQNELFPGGSVVKCLFFNNVTVKNDFIANVEDNKSALHQQVFNAVDH